MHQLAGSFRCFRLTAVALGLSTFSRLPASGQPAQPVRVQPAEPVVVQPAQPVEIAPAARHSNRVAPGTGFYWLLKAAEALNYDNRTLPHGTLPQWAPPMTPAQQLAYDRALVAQQSEPLKLLRTALKMGIERPRVDDRPLDTGPEFFNITYNARYRQLARVLVSESNVRAAAQDFSGALDSRLDCIELGVVVADGTFIDMMVGAAVESRGAAKIEPVVAPLDAPTCRAAAARLAAIETRRPAFAVMVRTERAYSYESALRVLQDKESLQRLTTAKGREELEEALGLDKGARGQAQLREFIALTPATLRQSNERFYDAAIEIAALPFQAAKVLRLPLNVDFYTAMARDNLERPVIRFIYERAALQDRLLQYALELRAHKLEVGAYPDVFPTALDPFSLDGKPLIYKREGDTYRLYSVGPDGKDDGGAAIQTVEVNDETGAKTVTKRLTVDSTGDILAPVL